MMSSCLPAIHSFHFRSPMYWEYAMYSQYMAAWQKLCEGTKGLRQKVWTRRKISNSNICYICYIVTILWFVAIYALFGRLWTKERLFWVKNNVSWAKLCLMTWFILHIILNWICKFAITRKNDAFVVKIANMRVTKISVAISALAERLPTSATLDFPIIISKK